LYELSLPSITLKNRNADTLVVLDYETTGLSPDQGDRGIEIGAVLLEGGKVSDRFQRLMNPGFRVSSFIEGYTGITNSMLRSADSCESATQAFAQFIDGHNLVAHNASFDRRFLDAEMQYADCSYEGSFACSMLAARRLYPHAPNHQLGTLVQLRQLDNDGIFHRALADAEMTALLWMDMLEVLGEKFQMNRVTFSTMQKLTGKTKGAVEKFCRRQMVNA
jgi:DNA polymerase-3 subunit epsilon